MISLTVNMGQNENNQIRDHSSDQFQINNNIFNNDINHISQRNQETHLNYAERNKFYLLILKASENLEINSPEDCYYLIVLILIKAYVFGFFLQITFAFQLNYMIFLIYPMVNTFIDLGKSWTFLKKTEYLSNFFLYCNYIVKNLREDIEKKRGIFFIMESFLFLIFEVYLFFHRNFYIYF